VAYFNAFDRHPCAGTEKITTGNLGKYEIRLEMQEFYPLYRDL
jgi:hypothetical protein